VGDGIIHLYGDPVINAAQARLMFQRGPFMYQWRGEGYNMPDILYCRTDDDLDRVCRTVCKSSYIVARPINVTA
jgi:hypothetical protein